MMIGCTWQLKIPNIHGCMYTRRPYQYESYVMKIRGTKHLIPNIRIRGRHINMTHIYGDYMMYGEIENT